MIGTRLPSPLPGLLALLTMASCLWTRPAIAQSTQPSAPPSTSPSTPYEDLRWKGLEVDLPGPRDTADGEAGDVRARLADLGIGYLGVSLQNFAQNALDTARTTNGRQTYSGQRPTYNTQDFLVLTYDTSRLGLRGGQIVVAGTRSYYTWLQGGPDKFGFLSLSYFQPFLDGKIEVKAGYLANSFEFANPYIGGALASGVFGQSGNMLLQAGLSGGGVAAPGLEVKIHISPSIYTLIGVERPISPDGTITEAQLNPTSLDFRVRDTGLLVIDETGYKVTSSPNHHELWIRGALASNSSRYIDYTRPGAQRSGTSNQLAYLLADYQVSQLDPEGRSSRGIYAGASVNYAPSQFNRFSQLYQARVYAKGLFDARPTDLISLVGTYNVFSRDLVDATLRTGILAHAGSTAVTVSYGAHLAPGVYLNLGATYVDHPTSVAYTPSTGSALVALTNLSLFF